ncbi:MAG: UvrD-helicase domain-containing protein [Acidimicrobiales bacterium]|nr:UvrD-helicase domain-containing protein [Acidimicrobiales bacterium]
MPTYDDPLKILQLWEEQWSERWDPTPEARQRFLEREEVDGLLGVEAEIVRQACSRYFRLADAWRWAEWACGWERISGGIGVELDSEQFAAVTAPLENTLVTSRAGSGKTRVLTTRAVWLQQACGVAPNELLLLAFNVKAAEEMKERLQTHLGPGAALPHVMTFDALAKAVVRPTETLLDDNQSAGQRALAREVASIQESQSEAPSPRPGRSDRMQTAIGRLTSRGSVLGFFLKVLLRPFVGGWERIESGGFDLVAEDAEALQRHHSQTTVLAGDVAAVDGTHVKSEGERLISNALFFHDVQVSYEEAFDWDESVYNPDFTIRTGEDSGVIIEYFGLLRDPEYAQQAREKRRYWKERPGWELIELKPQDIARRGKAAFTLFLLETLESHGVPSRTLSEQEILQRLPKVVSVDEYTALLTSFVTRCRGERMSSQHLRTRIRAHHPEDDAERDFLALAEVIYDAYLDEVIGGGFEDFKGIMWRAVSKVENGDTKFIRDRGRERGDLMAVRHILIDEFQDFTKPFHALIHAIQMVNTEARVFAVGDDWQAINGFAGSDLQFFNGFNRFFENTTKYLLTTNYRSAETIVAASNALMKPVDPAGPFGVASTDRRGQVRLWKLSRFTPSPSEIDLHGNERLIPAVLRLVNDNLEAGRDVHMLSRTNTMNNQDLKAFLRTVRSHLQPGYADRVQASTTHLFKGLEEQAIIILDADERRYPLIHPHWKYQRLFGDTEGKIGEEERRLFYVALTRAASSLDIINAKAEEDESPFLICLEHRVRHGSWDRIQPPRPTGEETVMIRVSGKTYPVHPILRDEQQYRWNNPDRCWQKSIPATELLDYATLESEPWFQPEVIVEVLAWDGEVLFRSEGRSVRGPSGRTAAGPRRRGRGGGYELGLQPGYTVVHRAWGYGVVESVHGEGNQAEAVIRFATVGVKRLRLAYAPLERPRT